MPGSLNNELECEEPIKTKGIKNCIRKKYLFYIK